MPEARKIRDWHESTLSKGAAALAKLARKVKGDERVWTMHLDAVGNLAPQERRRKHGNPCLVVKTYDQLGLEKVQDLPRWVNGVKVYVVKGPDMTDDRVLRHS